MSLGRVKYTAEGGRDCEVESADLILERGKFYEVENVTVHSWSSTYKLVGINKEFNTCLFAKSEIVQNEIKKWRESHHV